MDEIKSKYQSEPAYAETSLVRQPLHNFSQGFLCIQVRRDGLAASLSRRISRRIKQYHSDVSSFWNSSDEAILPFHANAKVLLDDALALWKAVISAETHTVNVLLMEDAAGKNEQLQNTHGFQWVGPFAGFWREHRTKKMRVEISARLQATYALFRNAGVSFVALRRTTAVLACLAASPKIWHDVHRQMIGSDEICRKSGFVPDEQMCMHGEPKTQDDDPLSIIFRIPDLCSSTKDSCRFSLEVDTNKLSLFRYKIQLWRNGAASLAVPMIGDSAADMCKVSRSRQRLPILHAFPRRLGSTSCRFSHDKKLCIRDCRHAAVEQICGCRLLKQVESTGADICIDLPINMNASQMLSLLKCALKNVSSSSAKALHSCIGGCKAKACSREAGLKMHFEDAKCSTMYVDRDTNASEVVDSKTMHSRSNRSILHFNSLSYGRPYDCIFMKYPMMDSTTLVYVLGGTLGMYVPSLK